MLSIQQVKIKKEQAIDGWMVDRQIGKYHQIVCSKHLAEIDWRNLFMTGAGESLRQDRASFQVRVPSQSKQTNELQKNNIFKLGATNIPHKSSEATPLRKPGVAPQGESQAKQGTHG